MNGGLPGWLGDLNKVDVLPEHITGIILVVVSGLCGAIVGLERERRDKPAGLRTLMLISMGATIFTMTSILVATSSGWADRARIAAQVVAGIGFLGAGAIIHERRSVVGLTTAATIWVVAAAGVMVGAGYAVPGLVLSILVYFTLTGVKHLENFLNGSCVFSRVRVRYRSGQGKSRARIQGILDECQIPDSDYQFVIGANGEWSDEETKCVDISFCERHRSHRTVLPKLAELNEVLTIEKTEENVGASGSQ